MYNETDDALNGLVNLLTGQLLPPAQSMDTFRAISGLQGATPDYIIHDEANYVTPPSNNLLDEYMQRLENLSQRYIGQAISESDTRVIAEITTAANHLMGEQLRSAGYRVNVSLTDFPNIAITVIPPTEQLPVIPPIELPETPIDSFVRRVNAVPKPELVGYDLHVSGWRASEDNRYLLCYYRVAAKHSKAVHTYNQSMVVPNIASYFSPIALEDTVIYYYKQALNELTKLLVKDVISFKKPFWNWVRIDAE